MCMHLWVYVRMAFGAMPQQHLRMGPRNWLGPGNNWAASRNIRIHGLKSSHSLCNYLFSACFVYEISNNLCKISLNVSLHSSGGNSCQLLESWRLINALTCTHTIGFSIFGMTFHIPAILHIHGHLMLTWKGVTPGKQNLCRAESYKEKSWPTRH